MISVKCFTFKFLLPNIVATVTFLFVYYQKLTSLLPQVNCKEANAFSSSPILSVMSSTVWFVARLVSLTHV